MRLRSTKLNGPLPPQVNHGALFSLGGEFQADANKFFAIVSVIAAVGITFWGLRKVRAKTAGCASHWG